MYTNKNDLFLFTALISLQELIRPPVPRDLQVVFRKTSLETFRDTLKDIRSRGIFSIVVDTKPQNLRHLLQAVSSSLYFHLF